MPQPGATALCPPVHAYLFSGRGRGACPPTQVLSERPSTQQCLIREPHPSSSHSQGLFTPNCKSAKEKSRPVATVCNRPALHNA